MASVFVLAILSLSLLFISCEADLIGTVCAKSVNPSLCTNILRSDPRARTADLRGLGQISVEKAKAATQDTISAAKSVGGSGKPAAETCVSVCGDAIDNLNQCSAYLKASGRARIGDLQTKGSAALTDVSTCDDEFGDSEPANVKQASRKAQDIIDMLLVVANSL
ncbi:hypothetical protein ABFS83_03G039100 [Erythranthe nasuta]